MVHLSGSLLGYPAYTKVTSSGINQREMKDMMPVVWSVEEVSEGLSTVVT